MKTAMDLIKKHEGLRLYAYKCPGGVWTVGYGHTEGVKEGDYLSVDESQQVLERDVAKVRKAVKALAAEKGVELKRNQEEALVSFAFNVGVGALKRSGLWRRVCAGADASEVAAEFGRWVYGGGVILPGLVSRRADEIRLYFSGQ